MTQPERQVDPWLTGVEFAIEEPGRGYEESVDHGAAVSSVETYGGGGGYSLAPAAANDMLGRAKEALKELQKLQQRTELLKRVEPPAKDPASVAYNARLANGSGAFDQGVSHIDVEIAYLKELIGKIEEAFKKITGRDASNAAEMAEVGEQSQTPPPTKSDSTGELG